MNHGRVFESPHSSNFQTTPTCGLGATIKLTPLYIRRNLNSTRARTHDTATMTTRRLQSNRRSERKKNDTILGSMMGIKRRIVRNDLPTYRSKALLEQKGHGSRVVKVPDRGWPCHEFEHSTTKDPPRRGAMHEFKSKAIESLTVPVDVVVGH
ncbi:hypothetical protein TNCV_557261 [Trichonephila clavipes]|uniref:Uncharacterized protein n=1 Tax=Trichonephila clavipes TaxID=2585209 RepID=A0A8X6RTI4_TRICX|nr:hypothetical protein TNCV_557261 [Trichonephila clavipes]